MGLMQMSSFICTEIWEKKNSRQLTKGTGALHSRFRQAWPSCLQFTLVGECKSKTEDTDMEFDISCAEGLWMCTRPHHCAWSSLWITSSLEMWHIVGDLSEPTELGSWLPAPPSACQLVPLHYHGWPPTSEQPELWLPKALLISLLAVGFRHLR